MRQRFLALALAGCLAATAAAQVTDQGLLNPDPQDWLMYSGTYNSHRHSPLRQLTPANVPRLQAKWVYRMAGQDAIQAVPIVHNGVMYISQFNRIDAIDARSGNIVWQYQRPPLTRTPQRGTAIFNNKLFVTAADGALVAIDSRTGHTVWETKVAAPWRLAGQAPLVAKGKVIVSGNTPSGFIQAYDAESGKYLWTWNAVPQKAGDPGSDTWAGRFVQARRRSGVGERQLRPGTERDLLWDRPAGIAMGRRGARRRQPLHRQHRRDRRRHRKIKWHFQNTPHDVHDWDSLEMPVLIDAPFNGQPASCSCRPTATASTTSSIARNGKFLQGTPFVSKVNWASGLSARRTADPDARPRAEPSKALTRVRRPPVRPTGRHRRTTPI